MGNLGWYQVLVTLAKKVGGPKVLLGLIAGGGALACKGLEMGVKKIKKLYRNKKQEAEAAVVHTVQKEGTSNEGLHFRVGDQFRVLTWVDNIGLIEKMGESDNPFIVSLEFIQSISDYVMA